MRPLEGRSNAFSDMPPRAVLMTATRIPVVVNVGLDLFAPDEAYG